MTAPAQYKWFFETTTPVEGHMHAIARTITTRQTKFQFMEIMETLSYGKCLVLDGRIQSSQADEFIYHELLVQPGLLAHPRPERAMVIGGGEGATVREILRHRSKHQKRENSDIAPCGLRRAEESSVDLPLLIGATIDLTGTRYTVR